ncbi:MAG: nucleotide sugar dehydrogenase [Chitinophagaceae bacterium]|nr:nucleotide sugar dehydrogenase [Chitinophagaceae bacterium]
MIKKIGVIGLGYVGLPLAAAFARKYDVVGFDIDSVRVKELNELNDRTGEVDRHTLYEVIYATGSNGKLVVTDESHVLSEATIFIITVPTPVDQYNRPDLKPLIKASELVGRHLKKGDVVIYESTVHPGCTEEDCIPILAQSSGLKFNVDFFCGYSPERINPGDKEHTFTKIRKITSGSTPHTAEIVDALYASVVTAGTYRASSIKVAEAAKVIENAQRDINVAFINELAKIFNLLKIDTKEVLDAAGTKWNFLPFKQGLVGGHCIGVDPYYLAQKAQSLGYHPDIILAGRRINDSMGHYVAEEVVRHLILRNEQVNNASILILGFTFKENCPDIRNTKVIDIYDTLKSFGCNVKVFDPQASQDEIKHHYGIEALTSMPDIHRIKAIVHAVAHKDFMDIKWEQIYNSGIFVYDVKSTLPQQWVHVRL